VNFREDLAAVLETPPSDALERVLRAAEVSEDVGAGQFVEELKDPINQIIDDLSSEDESSPVSQMLIQRPSSSTSRSKLPVASSSQTISVAAS
jgi:hypothetical protein